MKKYRIHTLLPLLLLSVSTAGQVVDTTRKINSWVLMHNYSRFEDVELDTSLFDLLNIYNPLYRNGIAYEHVGIIGNAAQSLEFFDRPGSRQFLFGANLSPYLATPDRTVFFNTRTPYTEIIYSMIPGVDWGEETIRFLHTQNMDPYTNIGLDFELLSGKELYSNEETRVSKFTLFGSRAKEKYSAFGTLHLNRFNNKENGGIQDPESFLRGDLEENWLYDVNLANAASSFTNLTLFYTQKFMISSKRSFTDTLGVTTDSGKNISFNHQILAERNKRFYKDKFSLTAVPDLYHNYYYFNGSALDSVMQDRVTNTFQIILGDPYVDQISARIYAGHEFSRYGQLSPEEFEVFSHFDTLSSFPLVLDSVFKDTAAGRFDNEYFNELFVGFHISGPPEKVWYWNVDGKYYLAGYYRHNFNASATFARKIFENYQLGLKGNIDNQNASYFQNHYTSSFFKWDNNFKASQLIRGEAFLNDARGKFNATASAGILTNYIYWNENALPEQSGKLIYIFSGRLEKHFSLSGFHSYNQVLLHFSTGDDVLRIPLVAFKTFNYWEQDLFKGALKTQIGIALYITSPYSGNAYMPVTGVFYLQNDAILGGYPFTDVFLGLQIKRTRIIGSFNNGFAGFLNNNYFTAAGYPTKPAYFRIGIAWTFYD